MREAYEIWTPEMASEQLNNLAEGQRSIKRAKVKRYVQLIQQGKFIAELGEAFAVTQDGLLVNGRNRMTAIVEAGQTVRIRMLYDFPDEYREFFDMGASRSLADILRMSGHTNSEQLATSIRAYHWLLTHFKGTSNESITETDALAYVSDHPSIVEELKTGGRMYDSLKKLTPSTAAAVLHHLTQEGVDIWVKAQFEESIITGENLPSGHPCLLFRNKMISLMGEDMSGNKSKTGRQDIMISMIHAWNAFATGGPIGKSSSLPAISQVTDNTWARTQPQEGLMETEIRRK